MILQTLIRTTILDYCLDIFTKKIQNNFRTPPKIFPGKVFKKIIMNGKSYNNCKIIDYPKNALIKLLNEKLQFFVYINDVGRSQIGIIGSDTEFIE